MRVKYNAPSANHRRVLPNADPNRSENDPEDLVWDVSNNFILEIPDAQARKLMDENPTEFSEAASEEPETRRAQDDPPNNPRSADPADRPAPPEQASAEWVEKIDSDEGDDMSTGSPGGSTTASRRNPPTRRA